MESYSNLVPLRYPASVAHKTRTRGVSGFDYSLAAARKPRKLRDEINDPPRDILLLNISKLTGGPNGIRTVSTVASVTLGNVGAIFTP